MVVDGPTTSYKHIGKLLEILGTTYFVGDSQYRGSWDIVGIAGSEQYVTPHNTRLDGHFRNGVFHGNGRLQWPRGQRMNGLWIQGRLLRDRSQYTFQDGLTFRDNQWDYCNYPDRRFYNSIINGLRPASETIKINRCTTRLIPPFLYDTGIGFFDPYIYSVTSYGDPKKVLEIPTKGRVRWIEENCRKGWTEPTGYRSWLDNNCLIESYKHTSELVNYVLVRTLDSPENSWKRSLERWEGVIAGRLLSQNNHLRIAKPHYRFPQFRPDNTNVMSVSAVNANRAHLNIFLHLKTTRR